MDDQHYHAFGEPADLGQPAGAKLRGPRNGCCRCADHMATRERAGRERPSCQLECYVCERTSVLSARLV